MIHSTNNIIGTFGASVERTRVNNDYLNDIRKTQVMSPDEERELFKSYSESKERLKLAKNDTSLSPIMLKSIEEKETELQDKIRDKIITSNQRFIFSIARRYCNNSILMDLVSIGTIGMITAIDAYDYKVGTRFCTLASWYIKREINYYLLKEHLVVRTTNNSKIIPKVKKEENQFFLLHGRKPSLNEISSILKSKYGINLDSELDASEAKIESINAYIGDDAENSFEKSEDFISATSSINDYENKADNDANKYLAKKILSLLSDKERTIICMASGYGYDKEYKDSEIGEALGLTSERIRQIRLGIQKRIAPLFANVAH